MYLENQNLYSLHLNYREVFIMCLKLEPLPFCGMIFVKHQLVLDPSKEIVLNNDYYKIISDWVATILHA